MFVSSADVFDLSLSDSCLQENEETTENGINPELAKVSYTDGSHFLVSVITRLRLPTHSIIIFNSTCMHSIHPSVPLTTGGGVFSFYVHGSSPDDYNTLKNILRL